MASRTPSRSEQQAKELSRKKAWEKEHMKYPFWFGGSAGCFAAYVTHPLDLGKAQLSCLFDCTADQSCSKGSSTPIIAEKKGRLERDRLLN